MHKRNGKVQRLIAFGCLHSPFTKQSYIDWLISEIAILKPNIVVNLGDLLDATSASVHSDSSEYEHDVYDEYMMASNILRSIRSVCGPKTKLVWTLGNHDDNYQKKDALASFFESILL